MLNRTSRSWKLGRSIAEALEREYVRISLGGLRDESDRGHSKRRTKNAQRHRQGFFVTVDG
jgi:hypothetical protein